MTDIVDKSTRSRMMAGIRGKNTRPEIILRKALHARGFRYRLHDGRLPGRPDIVLPRHRAVLFVNGCFWHRHQDCRYATTPASNAEFWKRKFTGTVERDKRNIERLQDSKWRIAIVWECALKNRDADKVADQLAAWLISENTFLELP